MGRADLVALWAAGRACRAAGRAWEAAVADADDPGDAAVVAAADRYNAAYQALRCAARASVVADDDCDGV